VADLVTVTTIEDGPRWLVMRFTNLSDGTGETGVVKVNAASAHGVVIAGQTYFPGINLKVREMEWSIAGMTLELSWAATTNAALAILAGTDHQRYDRFGGITCPPGLIGATGNILFTTLNQFATSSYTLVMRMSKGIPQS
jgi:hypothetical protein